MGGIEFKSRDLGSDRGYRVEIDLTVTFAVRWVGLNLNPHPHKTRVGQPAQG